MNLNNRALLGFGLFALLLVACPPVSPITPGSLTITPGSEQIQAGSGSVTFKATGVTGSISWTLNQGGVGTISPVAGPTTTYAPPSDVSRNTPVTLTASVSGTTVTQFVTLTITPAGSGGDGGPGGSDGGAAPSGSLWIPSYDDGTAIGYPGSSLGGLGTKALLSAGAKVLAPDAGAGSFVQLEAIAFNSHGDAWVSAQQQAPGIWGFPFNVTFGAPIVINQSAFSAGFYAALSGEAFGPDGTLWIADQNNGLWGFTSSQLSAGSTSPTLVTDVTTGTNLDSLASPGDLAFDVSGNLWVLNTLTGPVASNPSSTIMKFNYDAGFIDPNPTIQVVNRVGDGGTLDYCTGLAFDSSQHLWVACQNSNQVVEFATTTLSAGENEVTPIAVLRSSSFSKPTNVAFDNLGRLWVINWGSFHANTLMRFDNPASLSGIKTVTPSATFTGLASVGTGRMQFYPPPAGTGLR